MRLKPKDLGLPDVNSEIEERFVCDTLFAMILTTNNMTCICYDSVSGSYSSASDIFRSRRRDSTEIESSTPEVSFNKQTTTQSPI